MDLKHVFRHHGIPRDIVLDRGPQFTSWVWRAFCSALCASASLILTWHWINKVNLFLLLLGYHPQSNRTHKPEPGECAQVQLVTQQPGAPTCRGSSTRTTPWCPPRPACPRSWLCLANSSPCSSTRRRKLRCCLSR